MSSNHVKEDLHVPESPERKFVFAVVDSSYLIVRLTACSRQSKNSFRGLKRSCACFTILGALKERIDWWAYGLLIIRLDYQVAIDLVADFGGKYVEEAWLGQSVWRSNWRAGVGRRRILFESFGSSRWHDVYV